MRGKQFRPTILLRAAIRDARMLPALPAVVKPQCLDPKRLGRSRRDGESEAVAAASSPITSAKLERIAAAAQAEKADVLVVGTELSGTTARPQWRRAFIKRLRAIFSGTLVYVAHNVEDAETVPFWDQLDLIGASLYPPLGSDDERGGGRRATMRGGRRASRCAGGTNRQDPSWSARSDCDRRRARPPSHGKARKKGRARPIRRCEAAVLADWIAALDRPAIRGVLVWRWFTDPDAGGLADTDFTVQGKTAEQVLRCALDRGLRGHKAPPAAVS